MSQHPKEAQDAEGGGRPADCANAPSQLGDTGTNVELEAVRSEIILHEAKSGRGQMAVSTGDGGGFTQS